MGLLARLSSVFTRAAAAPVGTTWLPAYGSTPTLDVTPEGSLRIAAAQRATSLIANDIARLKCTASGVGADLCTDAPSRYHTQYEFRRALVMQALLYGNGCAYIARDGRGMPAELQLLGPETVSLQVTGTDPEGVWYQHQTMGRLELQDVIHLRTPNTSGLWGTSPIRQARDTFALGANLARTGNAVFSNAGVPKVAIVHPGPLSPEAMQRIANAYVERHAGPNNAGRPLVLGENMRVESISGSLEDALYIEAQNFSVQDIARIFGVPTAYLSEHSHSSYGSLEALMRIYVDGCLTHWAEQLAAEYVAKLLGPGGTVTWDYAELMRPTLAEQFAALRTGVEAGIITRNEARDIIGLDPLPGLDQPIVAKNMGTGGGATNIGVDTDMPGAVAGGGGGLTGAKAGTGTSQGEKA